MTSYDSEQDFLKAEYRSYGAAIKDLRRLADYHKETAGTTITYDEEKVQEAIAHAIDHLKNKQKQVKLRLHNLAFSGPSV